jgi:hypothetical protein
MFFLALDQFQTLQFLNDSSDIKPLFPHLLHFMTLILYYISMFGQPSISTCYLGCFDSSKNKYVTKHFPSTEHPIVQSFEPNEDWK